MNLSIRDAASLLGVSEETVFELARHGDIPHARINDQYRFDKIELLDWATSRRMPVDPALLLEADGVMPSLSDSLDAGGIFYSVGGGDLKGVFECVVKLLRLPEQVDRDYLLQILLAREASGTTGVGDGIAVPHTRSPIVLRIGRPTVTLCFLAEPVDFNAPDKKPVHTLFTIIGATVRTHLHLLSRIAWCLHDVELRGLIEAKADARALLDGFRRVEDSIAARSGGAK